MRFLIAPDKFKGSLTALAAAEAMTRGVLQNFPEAVTMPIADGGEGTAEAICSALGGKWMTMAARDPLGREVDARYAWLEAEKTAVIDMSEASGLWRISAGERNPMRASTFGTGQLMADALRRGAKKLLIGLGGSATKDGGVGMAEALGFQFFDDAGERLTAVIPANLTQIARIQAPDAPMDAIIIALCDVQNPLTGERGAARVFGPQKGADPRMVEELEAGLGHLADVVSKNLGCDFRDTPGAGAAGGLGFGLLSFCNAQIRSGFETLAAILHLEEQIAQSDIVLSGEGRLDPQTLEGKGPAGVAALAHKHGKRVFAFAGAVAEDPRLADLFELTFAITPAGMPLEEAMRKAAQLLEESVSQAAPFFSKPTA